MKLRLAGIGLLLATTLSSNAMAGENTFGFAITKAEIENTRLDSGFKIFGTIMPSDNFGVDFAHGKYGDLEDVEFSSTNIALVAATSGDTVNVYGKLGLALWEVEMMRRALAPLKLPVVLLKGSGYALAGLSPACP